MEEKGTYQLSLVERLSFVRYGGTDEELRAANILMEEIEKAGGKGEIMEFKVPAYDLKKCSMKVTVPYEQEIECVPYGLSGNLPEGGADLKFYYAPQGIEEDYLGLESLEGYVVMINQLSFEAYKLLCDKKASAFITFSGKWFDTPETFDLVSRNLRPKMLECGKLPGFAIGAKDATELVRSGAEVLHLELAQEEFENTSRDVLAVVPGTGKTGESIVITAHYDSVTVGTGSWDNATGSATIMALYRYFVKNPAKRTLRFIWCGSEEQGLYGSKAYVEQNEELLKEIKFCFNYDMCGTVLGPNQMFVTGGADLKHFAEQYCHEVGWAARLIETVHSSDSAPFADKGVPALGISRGSQTAAIHTSNDLLYPLCAKEMGNIEEFSIGIISRVANAAFMPVPTGMPNDMKEKIDKYFQRDKKSGKEE